MNDKPQTHVYLVAMSWTSGELTGAILTSPHGEGAAAQAAVMALRSSPAPTGELNSMNCGEISIDLLRMIVRQFDTGEPAQVLSLVPKAEPDDVARKSAYQAMNAMQNAAPPTEPAQGMQGPLTDALNAMTIKCRAHGISPPEDCPDCAHDAHLWPSSEPAGVAQNYPQTAHEWRISVLGYQVCARCGTKDPSAPCTPQGMQGPSTEPPPAA